MDYSFLLKTQSKIVKLFNNGLKKDRLAQVYLIEGIQGTPKMQAAMYLANMILCDTHDFCGKCINCKRIEEGVHPRLFTLEPIKAEGSSASIKKEQIDALEEEFSYSGLEKGPRVFIINDIEKATLSAENSLLKFLEEMKENCYGVLITSNLSQVLETIKSRCQVVTLERINKNVLKEAYLSKGTNEELARILCTLTNNVKEGLTFLEDETINKIISLVRSINRTFYNNDVSELTMNDEGKFLLQAQDKKYHQIFLDLLITITNDAIYYLLGEKDNIVFVNTIEELMEYDVDKSKVDYKNISKRMDILLECRRKIEYNVNIELLYMDMFIRCNK